MNITNYCGFAVVVLALFNSRPLSATLITIEAAMAGSVADRNGDGVGDNHSELPGPSPGLISAAVDASGGPGSNGTLRMHFEWDLSSLPDNWSITGAEIRLYTQRGTVDSLNTSFYHLTEDQDGLLTNSDFQSLATPLPVVMPVVSGFGVFSFDVTSLLQQDFADGNSYFSIQGRVDESLSGQGFRRGLQVYSTANSALQSPELVVNAIPEPTTFALLSAAVLGISCSVGPGCRCRRRI